MPQDGNKMKNLLIILSFLSLELSAQQTFAPVFVHPVRVDEFYNTHGVYLGMCLKDNQIISNGIQNSLISIQNVIYVNGIYANMISASDKIEANGIHASLISIGNDIKVNGIYASSDDAEAQKLIDYINRNKYNKSKKAQVDRSIQTLQTKFARDRAGENMKRYASQILNDSLRDFDATLNFNKSRDAGLTFVKYYGDVIPTTRELCKNLVNGVYNKRKGGLFTINEIKDLWQSRSWSGKKSGNPFVVRGGYNCRHQFSYVNPDWYDSKGELII